MLKKQITVTNAVPEHCVGIHNIIRLEYEIPDEEECDVCMPASAIENHIRRFPEGQFVALNGQQVVGYALTMRTNRSPYAPPLSWMDAIGTFAINNHQPRGEWLYGVDFAVHKAFRRMGIGTKMYRARFAMVKQLNLRGFYAGGMLVNYPKYRHQMSVHEYGQRVIRGDIVDPTVSMQINRGFKPGHVIEGYCGPTEYDNAMLIVWDNPQYQFTQAGAFAAAL
ncbi:MAG: GNAT family N-acetyltransferase [Anaerolineae bacterium]